jgi:cbb3-type cytochrome oxidase subunit 3
MEGSVWLLFLIAIIFASVIVFYFSPKIIPKIDASAVGPFELNRAPLQIIDRNNTVPFAAGGAGAFSAFVYLSQTNRTATYSSCGAATGSSCDNGEYSICTCGTAVGGTTSSSDCTNCMHTGYKQIFNIGGVLFLEVLVAPDASRQQKAAVQLVVKTQDPTKTYTESIVLPPLDVQKWTYVTISREGRRYDIFYNNVLILSKSTQYPMYPMGPLSATTSGSPGLDGQLIIANIYNYRLSSKDVANKYAQYADTRGRPFFNDSSNPMSLSDIGGIIPAYTSTMFSGLSSYIPSINICGEGGCITNPSIQPANPLYEWSSPYA